ncbi:hypothetical protein KP509_1Z005500 [Ceratopteris richardii]|nr:hypothetical protein KP509_1Z005500 [Ceratopteris richardii]KAH6559493.1 hypothetical protein KP509_1Z005500 [Ceratopteris richardii]KAH6559494.1 hypothetical protein KP509_1Z005500 [Ceratopteris richardii]KAH6559495.1 hypothetical protein KP509_1Z005500 [Ceratopteris richardii]KAH6559496.1 hypothetical protein KP509_1Z005500 [Ceratopteris richardii]
MATSNNRIASWASQVEEEDDKGWDVDERPVNAALQYPEAPTKVKKNKKKKKKNKGNGTSLQVGEDDVGNASVEDELKILSIGSVQSSQDANGWQVASSRKPKLPPAYSTQSLIAPSSSSHLTQGSTSNCDGEQSKWVRVQTNQRFESPGPFGEQHGSFVNPVNKRVINGKSEGPVHRDANVTVCQWRFSDAASQSSRTFSEVSKPISAFRNGHQGERSNTVQATNGRTSKTQVGAWGKPLVVPSLEEGRNQVVNSNILLELLPSEIRESEIQTSATFNASTVAASSIKHGYCVPELIDPPMKADSDSALSDADLDDDSDWIGSEQYDSEASVESLETRKRNKWFRSFFDTLDEFTNDQIMDHDRQWHCPACHGGVGAIDWYRGLQPLLAHAKTHRTKRIRLHREFANVLEQELEERRAGTGLMGETRFGKWKGLRNSDATTDQMIVWPPMVVIQNTQLTRDEQDKWIGMGNKELLDMFSEHGPIRARHAYGPQGHRGMSLLIFAESPAGYWHAERLARAFVDACKGREHWDSPGKRIFQPGGDRILYGYMASAEDMDIFNKHSTGKSKLKWELKRYKECVAEALTQMDKDNQQIHYLKAKVQKQKELSKRLEKSMSIFATKLQQREDEIALIRQRARDQYEANQKEMDELERTYKERIVQMQRNRLKQEEAIQVKKEELQLGHIERCEQLEKKLGEEEQQPKQAKMQEDIDRQTQLIELSLRETEEYEYKKRELLRQQHIRKRDFMKRQLDQLYEFEEVLEKERQELLDRYSKNMEDTI